MMISFLIFLSIFCAIVVHSTSFSNRKGVCIQSCSTSFTNSQKDILCTGANVNSAAVGLCASEAKKSISNIKFEEIGQLCAGLAGDIDASGASVTSVNHLAPVQCFSMYISDPQDKSNRFRGLQLCGNVTSVLPVECWKRSVVVRPSSGSVSSRQNQKNADVEALVDYCRNEIFDISAVQCIEVASNYLSQKGSSVKLHNVQIMDILSVCSSLSSNFDPALSRVDDSLPLQLQYHLSSESMQYCLETMLVYINNKPSTSVKPDAANRLHFSNLDIFQFCADSSVNAKGTLSIVTPKSLSSTATVQLALPVAYSIDCFKELDTHMKQQSPSFHQGGLTRSMIGNICRGSKVPNGASACALSGLAETGTVRSHGSKLSGEFLESLCVGAPGRGPIDCFQKGSTVIRNSGFIKGSGEYDGDSIKLLLCSGANNTGPIDCYQHATTAARSHELKNDVPALLSLCAGAPSASPAICASESPSYLSMAEKIVLCSSKEISGSNAGVNKDTALAPVECLKQVEQSYSHFKNAPRNALNSNSRSGSFSKANPSQSVDSAAANEGKRLMLQMCSYIHSDNPRKSGTCFRNAPASLEFVDAISMCTNVSSVENGSNELMGGGDELMVNMKMCMKLLSPKGWKSHELTVLCGNDKSNSNTNHKSDAISNIGSVVKCAQYVHGVLLYSKVEAAHICNNERVGALNKKEQGDGPILECTKMAVPNPSATVGSSGRPGVVKRIPSVILRDVCQHGMEHFELSPKAISTGSGMQEVVHAASQRGLCLNTLYSSTGSGSSTSNLCEQLSVLGGGSGLGLSSGDDSSGKPENSDYFSDPKYSNEYIVKLCTSPAYLSHIACIKKRAVKFPERTDIVQCIEAERSYPSQVRVVKMMSNIDSDPEITAGRSFTIWLQLVDQWGVDITHASNKLISPSETVFSDQFRVSLSINGNNEQSAVLWGFPSNYTSSRRSGYDNGGIIELNNLIISEPGPLKLILTSNVYAGDHGIGAKLPNGGVMDGLGSNGDIKVRLGVYNILVKADPTQKDANFCKFVFRAAMCDNSISEAESLADFPNSRHFLPISYYLHMFVCGALHDSWLITSNFLYESGNMDTLRGIRVSHRIGVAAVWLGGVGGLYNTDLALPRVEQTALERLGLVNSTSLTVSCERGGCIQLWGEGVLYSYVYHNIYIFHFVYV